jgi:hypothetical protein
MRPGALREATHKQAQSSEQKLTTRLSQGEKRGRKRMAEVCAVYEATPSPRSAAEILPADDDERQAARPAPTAKNKGLSAGLTEDAAPIVSDMFTEADRRDPSHQRVRVALVDGNNHQIDRIKKEAKTRKLKVTILIDVIHVIEYLRSAAWCFFDEGDPAIATGIIEGACRHLIKDRMDITGARWGTPHSRSHPETPRAHQQRRLRHLLGPAACAGDLRG